MSRFSELIKKNKSSILEIWEKQVRLHLTDTKSLSGPALKDSIPSFLGELSKALDPLVATDENAIIAKGVEHGEEREKIPDYTLEEAISEYKILTNVLFETIDPEGKMTLAEGKIIYSTITEALKNMAVSFAINRQKREKEKEILNVKNLRESENIFKKIIDGMLDYAVCILDIDGLITFWNAGASRMTGYTEKEVLNNNFSLMYPSDAKKRNAPMEHLRIAKEKGSFRGEGVGVRKNGELFMSDIYIIPLKRDEKILGFAKIVSDLTESNNLVRERDNSRTEAINWQIENELRETFIANLSHDLRNPLSVAKINIQRILRNSLDEENKKKLATKILVGINRTDMMIKDFLDANKIKASEKMKLEKSNCNLMQIVEGIVDEMSESGNNILIVCPKQVTGFWDFEGMKRVIENLLINAIKYGDQSKPITISFEQVLDRAILKVHNYGQVIELPEQLLLFDKFHQCKKDQDRKKIGWGIGLTVVKGIVEAHNGIVKVESFPEEGTTFTVDLPINSTDEQEVSSFLH